MPKRTNRKMRITAGVLRERNFQGLILFLIQVDAENGALFLGNRGNRIDERNFGPYQVGQDEYFVLVDNRPISKDSRMVGCISRDDLYGLVMFVAYPFDEIRSTMELPLYHSIGE